MKKPVSVLVQAFLCISLKNMFIGFYNQVVLEEGFHMLHIIILNKNYFPSKLNLVKPSDRVIVLASPDGAIPVSAYQEKT